MTLPRKIVSVTTPWGELSAKEIITPDGIFTIPEYEACRQVAEVSQVPLQAVYAAVYRAAAGKDKD